MQFWGLFLKTLTRYLLLYCNGISWQCYFSVYPPLWPSICQFISLLFYLIYVPTLCSFLPPWCPSILLYLSLSPIPPLSLFIYDQPLFSFQDNPIAIPKLRLTDHSKFGTFLTSKKVGGGSCMVANGQEIKFGQMQNIYRFWLWPLHWPMTLRTSGYLLTHCFSSLYAERLTGHWLWHHLRCLLVTRLGWRRLWSPWVATRYTSSVHSTRQFIYL